MISLAGAAAEEMYYGGRSTGSSNDFEQAIQIVQTMMTSGLTSLGIINMEMMTKQELMRENSEILNALHTRTLELLEQHRPIFDNSLDILMREEVLNGEQFRCQFRENALLPA